MARFFALVLTVLVTSAVEEATTVARAEVSKALRVEDRTVVCATQIVAGVRKFSIFFQPLQLPSANLPQGFPASVNVKTGFVSAPRGLVFATAGPKAALARPRIDMQRCDRTTTHVALSPRGLPGPPVRFQHSVDCLLAGRVLVRARVVSNGSRVTQAKLAVRMEKSDAPIAYARIDRDGSGVFYPSPRCD